MRKTGVLILVLLTVCLSLIILDQVVGLGLVKGAVAWLLSPIQYGLQEGGEQTSDFWERLRQAERLQEENAQLKEMVELLTWENRQYQEIKRENEELRELLGLQQRYPELELLYAEVIARDPGGLQQVLRVGWASVEGRQIEIEEGMPVISPAGLVGRVIEVYPNAADVRLITDIGSKVSAIIENEDRPTGIVDGQWQAGKRLWMRFIPQGDAVHEGDLVITSGLGLQPYEEQALPRGLAIGHVLRVEPAADLHQEAELLPAVDFDHLEKVMIVLGTR